MFESLRESLLPCARNDAETQAAAWKRVTWRGWRLENQQVGGQDSMCTCVEPTGPVREGTARMAWRVLAHLLLGGSTAPTSSARAAVPGQQCSGNAGGGGRRGLWKAVKGELGR